MGKVTIRDVAAAAGVSISAVSYILNGSTKKKYSEATVKAVRRAAEKLHYTPNSIARGMRSQRANAVGVVSFFEPSTRDFSLLLRAVTEAAAAIGSAAVLCVGKDDFSYIDAFRSRTVDGLVLIAPGAPSFNERAHARALAEAGVPFAILGGSLRTAGMPAVLLDYCGASALATEHLLSLGRKRVVYIDAFAENAARELRERREGYTDTMRGAGLLPRAYTLEKLNIEELGEIEAVVTDRAETARALMRRLLEEGLRVPACFDIVAGSGEVTLDEGYLPLTTVDFPFAEIGETAVRLATGALPPAPTVPSPVLLTGKSVKK